MKKIFAVIILFASFISAQNAGSSGMAFLKYSFGARNAALGETGVITSSGVTALNYNPALLSRYERAQVFFSHNELITDMRSEQLGAYFTFLGLPLAIGLNTTSIDDIEVRYKPGEALSKFNAHYFMGSISTGFGVMENLSVGFTAKYLYEDILIDNASGIGYDIGAAYAFSDYNVDLGVAVKNLGSMNELRNESTKLPAEFKLGAKYGRKLDQISSEILVSAAFNRFLDAETNHISGAVEFIYDEFVAVRTGYISGYDAKNISGGIGLLWKGFNIDYAYIPYDYELGNSHNISLTYNF